MVLPRGIKHSKSTDTSLNVRELKSAFINQSIPFQSGTNEVLEAFTCQINHQTFIIYV